MHKKKIFGATVVSASIALIFIAAMVMPDESDFITHIVKRGETVSLLCIEIYGHFSNELGVAFTKDNPDVKNINLIYVGQNLKFRKPVSEETLPTEQEKEVESVFQKKVNATQGVVTYVEGQANLTKKDSTKSEKLLANVVVYPGDMIKTGSDGRVELIINRESVVRMKENSELTIEAYRDLAKDNGKTSLNFSLGSVWTKMKQFKDNVSRFELELPTAIAGVHGTVYQSTVNSDHSAEVKVYDGEVAVSGKQPQKPTTLQPLHEVPGPQQVPGPHEVTMEQWTTIVRAMQSIRIDSQGKPTNAVSFQKNPNDSWEKWNEERDKRIAEMFAE
ncbi:FecR domain-containing protein [candidate division KSB1 bacterium]|nr:FecR domain-containing protein [candidate division KSB1 bacterium]